MRIPIPLLSLALSALSAIPSAFAIFADEAYHIDYEQQLLGLPQPHTTFFHRPRKEEKASLLYTLSDVGVVGAINPGTGAILWRQLLYTNTSGDFGSEEGLQGFLRAAEGEGMVVSAMGSHVNAWDAVTGREKWSNEFAGLARDLEVMESTSDEAEKDTLVLFEQSGKGSVRRLSGATGNVLWEHALEGADVPFQISTNVRAVFVVSLHGARGGYNLKITSLDPVTGKKVDEHTLASKSDVHGPEDIIFVGANIAAPIIAWTDKPTKALKANILGTKQIHTLRLAPTDEKIEKVMVHAPHLVQSQPHFLVHSQSSDSHWAEVYHIDIVASTITEAYHLPKLPGKGAFSTSSQEANVYFTRHTEDEIIIVASVSHGILGRWPLTAGAGSGSAVHGVSEVISKSASTYAVRSAIVSSEDNWDMIRNGFPAWRRNEGIAGAVAAAWADIPEGEDLAKTLEAEAHSNPWAAYIHRVTRHASDLQHLPAYVQALPKRFLGSILPKDSTKAVEEPLTRDIFGFRKLVIVATKRGRLYALDTGTEGRIVWSRKAYDLPVGENWNVKGILIDNAGGIATLRDAEGGEIRFKTATGIVVGTVPRGSEASIQSTAIVDSPSGQWLLSIGVGGVPAPFRAELTPKDELIVRGANGEVVGLSFEVRDDEVVQNQVWTFEPGPEQRILSVTARPAHDPVASIGRVLSDRTVRYKYLNPNTILVTTVSDSASTASFYLLDSVSGEILYSTIHESVDTSQPITSLLTENWFVYSLWADVANDSTSSLPTSKGYQLIVSELYESDLANNRGPLGASSNYSSLAPSETPSDEPYLPSVTTQAFLIPEPIAHMAVTQTRQGITSRLLLCVLASSHAIIGIPRNLLDPRRPVGRDPTAGEMEEGLLRYSPVIEFDPRLVVSHKREIVGVRGVIATPAMLESTSLVFAYGIDVFGTRLAPSQAFDILGNDFNRLSLVATVAALTLGVGVLAPMVRRKQINGRWKTA